MKTLVVYYSLEGNTKYVAEKIKEKIYAGTEKVKSTAKALARKAENAIKSAATAVNKTVNFVTEGIVNLFS